MKCPGLRGISARDVLMESVHEYLRDDLLTYAAAVAFHALFSAFPFVLFLTALLGYLQLEGFFPWLQGVATSIVPAEAAGLVNGVIAELQQRKGGLLSFGILLAVWAASAGIRVIMKAMNVAFDVPEARPAWKRYVLSILYTVAIAVMIVGAAALLMVGPQAMQWIAAWFGLHDLFVGLWAWLRWPVALLILMLAVSIIFHVAPNREQQFRFVSPGGVLAVVAWLLASVAFNLYVKNFGDYSAMYGSIGAIIVLLLYFFISAAVLLFGAEVNSVIERAPGAGQDRSASRFT